VQNRSDIGELAPKSLLATLQNDLKEETNIQEDECLPVKDHVDISRFDLGPTKEAWHVEGHYPCFGGNDMWDQLLYVRAGKGWRKILDTVGSGLEVCAGADPPCPVPTGSQRRFTSAHGWPDLGLTVKPQPRVIRLQFDGKVYKAVGGM
jgi:hypothetical protein